MHTTSRIAYEFGPFRLEPDEARLLRDGQPVRVTPKALDLLTVLVQNAGRMVTKDRLLAEVWKDVVVEEGNLSVNMSALRKALGDEADSYIETVPKRGYRFIAAVATRHEAATPQPGPAAVPAAADAPEAPPPVERTAAAAPATPEAVARGMAMRTRLVIAVAVLTVAAAAYAVWPPAAPTRSTRLASVRSVAVMPFQAMTATDQEHLELGMADAVITRLGALEQLSVPPTAALRPGEDPFEAAMRLRVDAVLTGTIQRDGDRIRVVAQLSDRDRRQLWAARFDALFTGIFDVQDQIAERIASNLLREVDATGLRRRESRNAGAYELYLRARERARGGTPAATGAAIRMFEEAVRLDPSFARAFTGMAFAYASAGSGLPPATRYPLARAAAEQALALDPQLAEAHVARAFVAYKADWEWERAARAMQRALELGPLDADARRMYGQLLTLEGRFDAAIDEFRRALALDRYSLQARADLAALLVHRGDVAEARQILEAGLAQDADSWLMHQALADVLAAEGREAESIDADLKAKLLVGDPHDDVESQREAYRRHGRTGLLRRQVELLMARHDGAAADALIGLSRYGVASSLALAHARLRDADQAMHWLQVAADRGEEGPLYLNLWHYDFLRDDPRFRTLHERVFGRR